MTWIAASDLRAISDQQCYRVKVHAFHFTPEGFHERPDATEQITQQLDIAFTLRDGIAQ